MRNNHGIMTAWNENRKRKQPTNNHILSYRLETIIMVVDIHKSRETMKQKKKTYPS